MSRRKKALLSQFIVKFGLAIILAWTILIVLWGSSFLGKIDNAILVQSDKANQQQRQQQQQQRSINSELLTFKEKKNNTRSNAVVPTIPWWNMIRATKHKVERRSSSDDHAPGQRPRSHHDYDGLKRSAKQTTIPSRKEGWFPTLGSQQFAQECSWTIPPHVYNNCTILARPTQEYVSEGISHWMAAAVTGHIVAQQFKCHYLFDYGPNIQMDQILLPHQQENEAAPAPVVVVDWRVPSGFRCRRDSANPCFPSPYQVMNPSMLDSIQQVAKTNITIPKLPTFRWPFKSQTLMDQNEGFRDVSRVLSGFHLESAMACSFERLFQLAPNATIFQPDLFTTLLPTLRAPNVLAIAIYIRTGHAEKEPNIAEGFDKKAKTRTDLVLECVQQCEQELLSLNAAAATASKDKDKTDHFDHTISYSRVVWMLVTDSPYVKDHVKRSYDKTNITTRMEQNQTRSFSYPRSVIITQSRGAHTKSIRGPSTRDFAEAFMDWYLIGESDIVVSEDFAPSFGDTAVFRTLRPYYKTITKQQQQQQDMRSSFDNPNNKLTNEKCTKIETSFKV